MAPIMNLMVVLIPLLLSSAQLIKISIIEMNLPPAASEEALTSNKIESKKKKVKLDLAITISDKGFYLSGLPSVLKNKKGKIAIPKKDGEYDYQRLAKELYAIKGRVAGRFPDANAVTIQAESQIDYQTLVTTMDSARAIRIDGENITMFPKASMSAMML